MRESLQPKDINDGITDAEQRENEQNLQEYVDDMEGGDDL